jgi:hypothetical protein
MTADRSPTRAGVGAPAGATSRTTSGLVIVETSYVAPAIGEPFYEVTATDGDETPHVFLTRDLPTWDDAVTAWSSGARVTVTWYHGARVRKAYRKPDETIAVKVATAITVDVLAVVSA